VPFCDLTDSTGNTIWFVL